MDYTRIICTLIAVAAFTAPGHATWAATPGPVEIDEKPVRFDLLDQLSPLGDPIATPAAPREGLLLMQFWASWCHSCGVLMWDMDEIVSANDGLSFLSVSLDEDVEAARRYVRKHALFSKYQKNYFVDEQKVLSASLGVETVPTVLLVSAAGELLLHKSGHLNSSDFRDITEAIRHHP